MSTDFMLVTYNQLNIFNNLFYTPWISVETLEYLCSHHICWWLRWWSSSAAASLLALVGLKICVETVFVDKADTEIGSIDRSYYICTLPNNRYSRLQRGGRCFQQCTCGIQTFVCEAWVMNVGKILCSLKIFLFVTKKNKFSSETRKELREGQNDIKE